MVQGLGIAESSLRNSRRPDPSTRVVPVNRIRGAGKVWRERTQLVRHARRNRGGIQLGEPSDCYPEQRFIRLSLVLAIPAPFRDSKRGKVGWEDPVCIAIDE